MCMGFLCFFSLSLSLAYFFCMFFFSFGQFVCFIKRKRKKECGLGGWRWFEYLKEVGVEKTDQNILNKFFPIKNKEEGCQYISLEVQVRRDRVWLTSRAHRHADSTGLQMTLLVSQLIGGGGSRVFLCSVPDSQMQVLMQSGLGVPGLWNAICGTCTRLQRLRMLIFRWQGVALWGGESKHSIRF